MVKGRPFKNMKNGKDTCRRVPLFFAFVLLFFAFWVLLHDLPLNVDDKGFWMLFTGDPDRILRIALRYGNGRLLGNAGVIVLLAWPKLGEIIRAAVLAGVTMMLPEVLNLRNNSARWLSYFLVFTVSPGIFAQCYSWMSGFQNYVPQFLFLLTALLLLRSYPQKGRVGRILSAAAILISGFCMQLYMEHSSLLNLLLALLVFLFCIRKNRKYILPALLLLLASVCGLSAMLIIPKLFSAGSGAYRSTYFAGGFRMLLYGVARNAVMLCGMFTENAVALGGLAALQTVVIRKNRDVFSLHAEQLLITGLSLPALLFAVSGVFGLHLYGKTAPAESLVLVLAFLVYVTAFFAGAVQILKKNWQEQSGNRDKLEKTTLAGFCIAFSLISVVPMLLVWPMGYRGLFHAYLFLISGVVLILDSLDFSGAAVMERVAVTCLVCVVFAQSLIFADIRHLTEAREQHVLAAMEAGEESVDYFMIPSRYIYDYWSRDNAEIYYQYRYGKYVRLNILPAEVWIRNSYYGYE